MEQEFNKLLEATSYLSNELNVDSFKDKQLSLGLAFELIIQSVKFLNFIIMNKTFFSQLNISSNRRISMARYKAMFFLSIFVLKKLQHSYCKLFLDFRVLEMCCHFCSSGLRSLMITCYATNN